jgi:hypothetical protein
MIRPEVPRALLENMWPLAWVLGFPRPPALDGKAARPPRRPDEVERLEDRFSGCHNAVRSARLGGSTVPRGFDPVVHGRAIQERRHALSWCLSPGTSWDDTDLAT